MARIYRTKNKNARKFGEADFPERWIQKSVLRKEIILQDNNGNNRRRGKKSEYRYPFNEKQARYLMVWCWTPVRLEHIWEANRSKGVTGEVINFNYVASRL